MTYRSEEIQKVIFVRTFGRFSKHVPPIHPIFELCRWNTNKCRLWSSGHNLSRWPIPILIDVRHHGLKPLNNLYKSQRLKMALFETRKLFFPRAFSP